MAKQASHPRSIRAATHPAPHKSGKSGKSDKGADSKHPEVLPKDVLVDALAARVPYSSGPEGTVIGEPDPPKDLYVIEGGPSGFTVDGRPTEPEDLPAPDAERTEFNPVKAKARKAA